MSLEDYKFPSPEKPLDPSVPENYKTNPSGENKNPYVNRQSLMQEIIRGPKIKPKESVAGKLDSPDFSPNSGLASESKQEDTSVFDGRKEISQLELDKKLKSMKFRKMGGKYKIEGKYTPSIVGSKSVLEIKEMLPAKFRPHGITRDEVKKAVKIEKEKIHDMKKDLAPQQEVYKEEKRFKFFKDLFGIK